jgi:hypothetical protein
LFVELIDGLGRYLRVQPHLVKEITWRKLQKKK